MSTETNRRAVLRTAADVAGAKKGLAAALPTEGPRTVGKPDIASVRLPDGAVTAPGYLTFPAHLKGKDPS